MLYLGGAYDFQHVVVFYLFFDDREFQQRVIDLIFEVDHIEQVQRAFLFRKVARDICFSSVELDRNLFIFKLLFSGEGSDC